MPVVDEERAFYCHDSLQPYASKFTESAGMLTPGEAGDFVVDSATTAQELQEKYPGMIVQEHPRYMTKGKSRVGRTYFSMPRLPYETEFDRRQKAKRENHAESAAIHPLGD